MRSTGSKRRTYRELIQIDSFEERFRYLALRGDVGAATFGFDRWINQAFYASRQWKHTRRDVIVRDNGCDLGIPGYEIHRGLYVHHMNPLTPDAVEHGDDSILDPDNLIVVSLSTHNAIHYGDARQLPRPLVERQRGDTTLWSKQS